MRCGVDVIERDPANVSINYFYDFTYEQTGIAVPYAREHKIPICPFDWVPSGEDSMLGWGFDLDATPAVRPTSGYGSFTTFDADTLQEDLFWAEAPSAMHDWDDFVAKPQRWPGPEMARRLFLYRTAFQARRIGASAHERPGGTILVLVGADHIHDLKSLLAQDTRIDLIDASAVGRPNASEIAVHEQPRFMFASLNFNMLGVQSLGHAIDWPWMREMVAALSAAGATSAELELLRLRLARLTGSASPAIVLRGYRTLLKLVPEDARFTWNGVEDDNRIDSFYDPFGNLTIKQRVEVEIARECYALECSSEADRILESMEKTMSQTKSAQLAYYWSAFLRVRN